MGFGAGSCIDCLGRMRSTSRRMGCVSQSAMGGRTAEQIDGVIAGNTGLMVTIVHGDRAYIWRFVPWDRPQGMHDVFSQMQTLYDTVINSFQLLD